MRTYRDVLSRLRPRRWRFTADGEEVEGELLLLEVLNIASVGPNLVLSPDADPSDGHLDVVSAGEAERGEIDEYLRQRAAGCEVRMSLPTRRVRRVEADQLVAGDAAHQQLPVQARGDASGTRPADAGRRSGGVGHALTVPAQTARRSAARGVRRRGRRPRR